MCRNFFLFKKAKTLNIEITILTVVALVNVLVIPAAMGLPGFSATTGCDIIAKFCRKGPKLCWPHWQMYLAIMLVFLLLSDCNTPKEQIVRFMPAIHAYENKL